MAPLHCAAKFDTFLSLDCAGMEGGNFAIWQPWDGESEADVVFYGSMAKNESMEFGAIFALLSLNGDGLLFVNRGHRNSFPGFSFLALREMRSHRLCHCG